MKTLAAQSWTSLWTWVRHLGPLGLILLGIADSAPFIDAPPGSVDISLILLCAGSRDLWALYAFLTTLGETLGGYMTYVVSEKGGQETLEKKVGKARADQVYKKFEKHGFIAIFGGAIAPPPFPFTPVPMAAGILHYPRKKFFTALVLGRSVRFFTEAFLGRTYSRQMVGFFSSHYHAALIALCAFAALSGMGALIYFKYFRKLKKSGNPELKEHVAR